MSAKDSIIEIIRGLPDDATVQEILYALGGWSTGELTDDEWRQVVAHSLADELSDIRQDIYTLDDGVPNDDRG